jgi:HAD superfamily hydrolase (TIGR01509 family)
VTADANRQLASSPGLRGSTGAGRPTRPLAIVELPEDTQPPGLDALSARWRVALDTAKDALHAASACGTMLGFAPQELHAWTKRLEHERDATARLIDSIAREENIPLLHRLSAPRASNRMLGLPPDVRACVFDLDGVLTGSETLHAAAWAETFDQLLSRRAERTGERFAPFKPFSPRDYDEHIHGKPRLDGVHAFLASRGIRLPEGHPDDPPDAETVYGLSNRKKDALLGHLDREGAKAHEGSRRYLEAANEAGLGCAVVSSSAHTSTILERAGFAYLIERRVDAATIHAHRLRSKPAPDTLLAACERLGVTPQQAVVFETTVAGVAAARAGGFGLVIAVDRAGTAETLRAGATVVVNDLAELLDPVLLGRVAEVPKAL